MREIVVDVSGWQEPIDWQRAIKDNEQRLIAAIIKLSEEDFHSKAALGHAKGAKGAGLPIGWYHFAHPERRKGLSVEEDAQKEAGYFVAKIREMAAQGLTQDIYPTLDIEAGEGEDEGGISDEELVKWVTVFLDYVTGALALDKMMVYANKKYIRHLLKGGGDALSKHVLWIAGDNPEVPGIWARAQLWQTPERIVPWSNGKIDIDLAPEGLCPILIRGYPMAQQKCGPGGAPSALSTAISTPAGKVAVVGGIVAVVGGIGFLLWRKYLKKK